MVGKLTMKHGNGSRCTVNQYLVLCVWLLAIISPILMAVVPRIGIMAISSEKLECSFKCESFILEISIKLISICLGIYILTVDQTKPSLTSRHFVESLMIILILISVLGFWLLYIASIIRLYLDEDETKFEDILF